MAPMTPSADGDQAKAKKAPTPQATIGETLGFAFECGPKISFLFASGCITGVLNGMVYPALAYLFSSSFTDLTTASTSGSLDQIRTLAFTFMILGVYALVVATLQTLCFEIVAHEATQNFRLKWFSALLRQDAAYFDVNDVGGMAGQIGPSSNKYRRGLGRKFGEGIQFLTTGVGGIAFAFYSCWQIAFVVLGVLPFCGASAMMVMTLNQTKGARSAASYKQAGGVAYSAVSAIKTVLSLNAVQTMIEKYAEATLEAYRQATSVLIKQGFANGAYMAAIGLYLSCISIQLTPIPMSTLLCRRNVRFVASHFCRQFDRLVLTHSFLYHAILIVRCCCDIQEAL
jgi:ATP-binding cassette, subfamily B (MDR/TAP), member 1